MTDDRKESFEIERTPSNEEEKTKNQTVILNLFQDLSLAVELRET
jgi:hypothetical protein